MLHQIVLIVYRPLPSLGRTLLMYYTDTVITLLIPTQEENDLINEQGLQDFPLRKQNFLPLQICEKAHRNNITLWAIYGRLSVYG